MRLANSFIGVEGVGERTERALWRAGITSWEAFDAAAVEGVGPTLADRIERFIGEARDRLAERDARYFASALPDREAWRLFEDFRADVAYLDIETTGLDRNRDHVTVVGIHRDDGTRTLVRGRDLTTGALEEALDGARLLVTFNGARFDLPFLRAALGTPVARPHVDLRYPCRRLGLTGGLKAIERTLGVERDRPDLDGRAAVRLWRRYDRRGDERALQTLLEYNRDDAANLEPVMASVADRLHRRVFEAAVAGGDARPARG